MSIDPSKLYRNKISPETRAWEKQTRSAIRSMRTRPEKERVDVAARLWMVAFQEGLSDADTQQAILLAVTITGDADPAKVADRVTEFAHALGIDGSPITERILRVGGGTGKFDPQRFHFDSASRLAKDPSFANHEDDNEAVRSMLAAMDPERADHMRRLLCDMTQRTVLAWQARWGQSAFPVANIADVRYAASLCTTTMPVEFAEQVIAPWRAFMIQLPPEDLLSMDGPPEDTRQQHVRRILVHQHLDEHGERVWSYVVEGERNLIDRTCIPTRDMCSQTDPVEFEEDSELTQRDRRVLHMCARIVIGTCMAFGVSGAAKRVGLTAKSRRRTQAIPTKWEYVIGNPVRIDASPYVQDYCAGVGGKRGPRSTQTLVRGHWKMQPYGPNSSLRKFIHREPYWSGMADAPIIVRPHVITTAEPITDAVRPTEV